MSRRNKCCHEENFVAVKKKPNFEPKYIEYLKSILCLPVGCRSKGNTTRGLEYILIKQPLTLELVLVGSSKRED